MLNECIEKDAAHKAARSRKRKDRKQQADIGFNFIVNIKMNGGVENKREMRRQKKQLKNI